ncbi:MAG TPA: PspC domain-containing protein [Opitutaceae bacterium]|jgi:phage shock protein PspC (stress-responsive transcriptional regulator)
MKGDILDFNLQAATGLISGDDGGRYSFGSADWKDTTSLPARGMRVDFEVQDGGAVAIYALANMPPPVPVSNASAAVRSRPDKYQGCYRSSDEKSVGGVCAGLAHMSGWNPALVQIGFVVVSLFFGVGILIYIAMWIFFEPLPTRRVKFKN